MNENIELLKNVYRNAEMGQHSLYPIIRRCRDDRFREVIGRHYGEYTEIVNEAKDLLLVYGEHVKSASRLRRGSVDAAISMNMMLDATSTHLAEMVLQGSVMGIIDMTRSMREYPHVACNVKKLAQKLLDTEDRNMAEMRMWV